MVFFMFYLVYKVSSAVSDRTGSELELMGSVYGCLSCALEASTSFLGIAMGSVSFINSPSHTRTGVHKERVEGRNDSQEQ